MAGRPPLHTDSRHDWMPSRAGLHFAPCSNGEVTWSAKFSDGRRDKTRSHRNGTPFEPSFSMPTLRCLVHDQALNGHAEIGDYFEFLDRVGPEASGIELVRFSDEIGELEDGYWHPTADGHFFWSDGVRWRTTRGLSYADEKRQQFQQVSGLAPEESLRVHRWFEAAVRIPQVSVFVTDSEPLLGRPFEFGVQMASPSEALGTIGLHMRLNAKAALPTVGSRKSRMILPDPQNWAADEFVPEIDNLARLTWHSEAHMALQLLAVTRLRMARCLTIRDHILATYVFNGWQRHLGEPADHLVDFALHLNGLIDALGRSLKRVTPELERSVSDRNVWREDAAQRIADAAGGDTATVLLSPEFQAFRRTVALLRNTIHSIPPGRGTEGGVGRTGPIVRPPEEDVQEFLEHAQTLGLTSRWVREHPRMVEDWTYDHAPRIDPIAMTDDLLGFAISYLRAIAQDDPWRRRHDQEPRTREASFLKGETSYLPLLYGLGHLVG